MNKKLTEKEIRFVVTRGGWGQGARYWIKSKGTNFWLQNKQVPGM